MSTEARPQPVSALQAAAGPPPWSALPVVLVGIFMPTLDFFIVNVAVPSIQTGLHATAAAVQLVIATYGVAYAAGLITGGRLGDLYGRRRVFMVGLAAFTLTSLFAGVAQNTEELITARVLQGVAAAVVTPQVLGIISTAFTGKARTPAFNAFGLSVGLAGVFGQILGGALIAANIDDWGWRSIFLINVPVGLVALALAPRLVPESHGEERNRLDLVSMLLVSAGLTAVVLPLVQGRQLHWPEWTWLMLIASVPLLAGFVAYQNRLGKQQNGSPLIDLTLFRERAFSAGLAITLTYFLAMGSFFLVLALYLQQGQGLSPMRSGVVFITVGAGFFITSAIAPAVAAKLGRQILAVGALEVAAGYAITAETAPHLGHGSVAWLIPGLLVAGFGMGFVTAPLSSTVLARVAPRHAAAASGALSTAQEAGGALGVALVGLVYFGRIGHATSAQAFALSLELLIGFCVLSAILVQFLPRTGAQPPAA